MGKITFTVTNDLNYDQRMDRICTALAKEGYKVTLIGRKFKNSLPLKNKPYEQERISCFINKGKFFYLEYNLRLFFKLLFIRAEILSAVDLDTALPVFCVSRIRAKKFVYDSHEYFTEVIELVHRPAIKKVWLYIEGCILPRTKFAYTVSESIKKMYEKKYAVQFEVIRNVPLLERMEEKEKEEKVLVYIGAVNEGRGLEEMIDAMSFINSKLHIYGNGDLYHKLLKKAEEKGLTEKVKLFGYVEPVKLKELTREGYIGILLLNNRSQSYYYSLANKFFDYMHAGIPQITVDFPEYRAINEKYKVAELVSLEKEALVNAVNRLLNDETYYKLLKDNCRKASEEYNWQKESVKLVDFYKKVIGH